jgi:hypothetical protein
VLIACERAPRPRPQEITIWRPLAAWSGQGVLQTDPFTSNTGFLRVTWEARSVNPTQLGTLQIALHSDVSGRRLAMVLERRGPGRDVTYVSEDPRSFYLLIESTDLEWSVDVAEGIPATRR